MAVGVRARPRPVLMGWLMGLIVLGSAGCVEVSAGLPNAPPLHVEWTGTFENGCSPVDAAGIIVDLTSPQLEGLVQIATWADHSFSTGSSLSFDMDDSTAVAAYCRAAGDCQVATRGEMRILQAEDGMIRGELWLDLPQAGRLEGPFEAQWVESGPVACG